MAGRHTITIELDDDEYRALEAEAERTGADVESAMHGLLRSLWLHSDDAELSPAERREALARLRDAASMGEIARSYVRQPFTEDDLLRLIAQARADGDARR